MSETFDPKTGELVSIEDPLAAAEALRTGKTQLPADRPVQVRKDDGTIEDIDPQEDRDFLRDLVRGEAPGYRLATSREVEMWDADQRTGEAFFQEFARSLTFGASDEIQARLSDDPLETRQDLQTVREANPNATLAGGLVGDVGSALASGGTSLAAKGAAKVVPRLAGGAKRLLGRAPMGLATQAAEKGGQIAGRAVTKALGGSTAAQIAGGATKLAAEGAIDAATFTLRELNTQQILTQEDVSGEEAIAALGHNALYGVGGMLALGGGAKALGAGGRAVGRGVARAGEKAAELVPKQARETLQDIYNKVTGKQLAPGRADDAMRAIARQEKAQKVVSQNASAARKLYGDDVAESVQLISSNPEMRKAALDPDGFRSAAQKRARKAATEFDSAIAESTNRLVMEGKSDIWRRTINKDITDDAVVQAEQLLLRGDDVLEAMSGLERGAYRKGTGAKNMERVLQNFQEQVGIRRALIQDGSDAVESSRVVMEQLDSFKRQVYTAAESAYLTGRSEAGDTLQSLADETRELLERSDLWGEAADAQREINEKWHERIAASKAYTLRSMTGDAGVTSPLNRMRQAQEVKKEFISKLFDEAQDLDPVTREHYLRYLQKSQETAEVAAKYGFEGAEQALPKMQAARAELDDALRQADVLAETKSRLANADRKISENFDNVSLISSSSTILAGTALGGASGGLAGAGLANFLARGRARLKDPIRHAARAIDAAESGVERRGLLQELGEWAHPQVVRALSAVRKTREVVNRTGESLVSGVRRAGPIAIVNITSERFTERAQRVYDDTDADGLEDFAQTGEYAQRMTEAFGRGRQFLRDKLPPQCLPDAFSGGRVKDAGEYERWRFMQYVEAVENPLGVLDQLSQGEDSSLGMEALREVYPDLVNNLQSSVVEKLQSRKKPVDYETRLRLEQIFPELRQSVAPGPPVQAAPERMAASQPPPEPGLPVQAPDSNDKISLNTERLRTRMQQA